MSFQASLAISLCMLPTPSLASVNASSLWDSFINDFPTSPGSTPADEIKCYGLPYGGIGFASHVLTYYTLFQLTRNPPRSPLKFKKITHWKIDIALALLSLIGTVGISVITLVRCRNRWEFITITVWKMLMSLTLGFSSLTASNFVRKSTRGAYEKLASRGPRASKRYENVELSSNLTSTGDLEATLLEQPLSTSGQENARAEKQKSGAAYWIILYGAGVIVGLSGLLSLVVETIKHNHQVLIITIVFASVIGAGLLLMLLFALCIGGEEDSLNYKVFLTSTLGLLWSVIAVVALAAFYSDWILGAIAGSLSGVPSSDVAPLYWTYFIVKRFPLFSF